MDTLSYTENSILCGLVQLGKTKNIIQIAYDGYLSGYDILIILNNSKLDLLQLESRVKLFCSMNKIKSPFKFLKGSVEQFKYVFETKKKPEIYVIIGHYSKIELFKKYYNGRSLYIIFDESDLFSMSEQKIADESISKAIDNAFELIKMASGTLRVSATPHAHWIGVEALPVKCKNVFEIPINKDYISIGHPRFEVRETCLNYIDGKKRRFDDAYESELLNIMDEIRRDFKFPITYINPSNIRACHQEVAERIRVHYPQALVVVVNTGSLKILNHEYFFEDEDAKRLKTESLQNLMSFLQVHTDLFDSIVLVGGRQVSRGISPRSEVFDSFENVSDIIYVNTMIYTCVDNKPTDDLIQTGLRMSGIFPKSEEADVKLRLYANDVAIDNIQKQLEWSKKILAEFKKNPDKWTIEAVPPIDDDVVINRPYSHTKNSFRWVKGPDGKRYATTESVTKVYENDPELLEEILNKIRDWSRDDNSCIISKFIKRVDPLEIYEEDTLLNLAKQCGSKNPESFLQNCRTKTTDGSYGIIFHKSGNKYSMYPEIAKIHQNYF